MASLSIHHTLPTKNSTIPHHRPVPRTRTFLSCQSQEPVGSSDPGQKKEKKAVKPWIVGFYSEAGKKGEQLRESLSPKQKGDWKDVLLMSLSFAVYVYISQKLVCAYCVWMSMLNYKF